MATPASSSLPLPPAGEVTRTATLEHCGAMKAKISSPTETERCIESLIAVFQKYAGKDGYNYTLSKTEFLSFMNTELAAFTKNQKDPGVLDRMMKKLDTNSDGQLDFSEFLNLIGGLAMACHDSFLKAVPSQKRT
uniref:Protein S100 n=2 Tax=Hominidae TaxID=9604 RepID=A0A8I5YTW7_PONAB